MKILIRAGSALFCLTTILFAADYFPLSVGNSWTYSSSEPELIGSMEMKVEEQTPVGSDTFNLVKVNYSAAEFSDPVTTTLYILSSGNDVLMAEFITDEPPYEKGFEHQPVAGRSWVNIEDDTCKIVFYGTFTVAAGSFSNCYAVVCGGDTSEIYAPDVGMIALLTDGVLNFELSSYNVAPTAVRYKPGLLTGRTSFPATGSYPGLFSVVDIMGRQVNKSAADISMRSLLPGTYVAIDKRANVPGSLRAQKLCVTGR